MPILVFGHALDAELVSRELLLQRREQFLRLGVEAFALLLPRDVADRGEHLALVRKRQAVDVNVGMLEQHLLLFGRGWSDEHDRLLVAAKVRRGVQRLVVERKEKRVE